MRAFTSNQSHSVVNYSCFSHCDVMNSNKLKKNTTLTLEIIMFTVINYTYILFLKQKNGCAGSNVFYLKIASFQSTKKIMENHKQHRIK